MVEVVVRAWAEDATYVHRPSLVSPGLVVIRIIHLAELNSRTKILDDKCILDNARFRGILNRQSIRKGRMTFK